MKTPTMSPTSPTEWHYVPSGLEPVPAGLEPVPPQHVAVGIEHIHYQQVGGYEQQYRPKEDQIMAGYEVEKIGGMRKKTFFIAFIFALLILGGALAGGLAGGLASKRGNENKSASQSRQVACP
jgi:hypothetical protein